MTQQLRRSRCHQAALVLVIVTLSSCGSAGTRERDDSAHGHLTVAQLEAHNRARARRVTARARRLERQIGKREAAQKAAAARSTRPVPPRTSRSTGAPPIEQKPIPFPARRKQEMAAYARRHYGVDGYRLSNPRVIVEHYTESATAQSAFNTFAPDVADSELHELPGVCAHFVIDRDGTIFQLVPLTIMCRHTVGLNYTAIGIEHAGFSDQDILSNPAQLKASLSLTNWLRCRFGVDRKNVIGHNESLSSPYHHELVARLRSQTHGDWTKADMDVYRSRLASAC